MPAWPTGARLSVAGWTEQAQSKVARTESDDGYVKQTRVRSRSLVVRQATVHFAPANKYTPSTDAWKQQFQAWVENDLNGGAKWFDWTDPATGQSTQARIRDGVVAYRVVSERPRIWEATLELETYE